MRLEAFDWLLGREWTEWGGELDCGAAVSGCERKVKGAEEATATATGKVNEFREERGAIKPGDTNVPTSIHLCERLLNC